MPQDDAERRGSHQLHRRNEFRIAKRHRLGAGDTRIRRPRGDSDCQHRIFDPRPESSHQRQCQNQLRKGEKDVGNPHQHCIHPATRITGNRADDETDGSCDDRHQHNDKQRQPRPVDQARKNITPLVIGAEQVTRRTRRQKPRIAQVALHRIMRRQHIGKDRNEDQKKNDAETGQRQPVGGKPPPDHIGAAKPCLMPRGRLFG
ncbi:hypothetical protein D3C80_881480 [compost metagenome]